jgi:RNA polymerase sigma-70 factor (ECF subfamily)
MTGDASRVEALGQEAFLRLFREAKSYQYPRRFATWFYTIVRNLCKNELRWRSRHPTVSLDEPSSSFSSHSETRSTMRDSLATSSTDDPLERLAGAELEARLLKGLEDLPESEREVLILSRFQGFRYREISEIVGLPMATVRSRIHTALDRLRNSIKDFL